MTPSSIGIIGGGIGGLFAARALARDGHAVTVFEPDSAGSGDPDQAFLDWKRPGNAQLRQPHAARALIVRTLREKDPELLEALLAGGMVPWNFHLLAVDDPEIGHDPELQGLLGRRPTFEMPLRRLVQAMPGVRIVQAAAKGLLLEGEGSSRRAAGVLTAEGPQRFDAVIETSGRRSRIVDWLQTAGITCPPEESSECGLVYYSRYFRFRPEAEVQRGLLPSGPSASLPGIHFTMNRTDRGTFSLMLGTAAWREEFRGLRHPDPFMRFVRQLPGADSWLHPSVSEPIWKVEPFAGLTNRIRRFSEGGRPLLQDLYVVGDARFHTNPIQGWGMSFAMCSSYLLADTFARGGPAADRLRAFEEAADRFARTYYEASALEDAARTELWRNPGRMLERGEPGTYRYQLTTVLPAIYKDQWIFRKVTRRLHLLDDPSEILRDEQVLERARRIGATLNQEYTADRLVAMAVVAAAQPETQQA